MKKINWFLIIIIFLAGLLIVTVIWIYAKRIENIESKMNSPVTSIRAKLLLHKLSEGRRKTIYPSLPDSSTGKIYYVRNFHSTRETAVHRSASSQAYNQTMLNYFSPGNIFIFGREPAKLQKLYPPQFVLYPGELNHLIQ